MIRQLVRGSLWRRSLVVLTAAFALGALLLNFTAPAVGQSEKKTTQKKQKFITDIVAPKVKNSKKVSDMVAFIDSEIERLWKENKIEPAERCSDHTFIRRATLDLLGRIAKIEEIDRFFQDPPNTRRSLLIERLLASDEFANHFANIWTTLLLTRGSQKLYRDQMHYWLYEKFADPDHDWSKTVHELITATGRTNENGAVNFVLAHLGEEIKGERRQNMSKLREELGRYEMVPVTSRTTKLFLGLQTQCTQCHDHPFNDVWMQYHFWGINAFFRQVDAPSGRPLPNGNNRDAAGQFELKDNDSFNTIGIVPYERRNAVLMYTKAKFLDGTRLDRDSKNSRREDLAEFITTSPYFAKVFVNRMWGHFFGISFTRNAPDDFGDHNPVSHPKLLEKMSREWAEKYDHNPKTLVRWITNSKAYGLDSVANESNDSRDAERFFARMMLKAMTPEQLFESLMVATQSKAAENTKDRNELREKWLNRLVNNFGDDEGNEQTFNGTVIQALLMMNGKEINDAITDKKNGTVAYVLNKKGITPQKAMEHLYLSALNRPPTEKEYNRILSPDMINLPKLRRPRTRQEIQQFYTAFYQDLFWAILNSNEFFLNH